VLGFVELLRLTTKGA